MSILGVPEGPTLTIFVFLIIFVSTAPYSAQLRQMSSRVKQAGPGYEEAASLIRQASEKLIVARAATARRMGQPQPQFN